MDKLNKWLKAKRGRRGLLATELNISPGAISQWRKVPAERIGAISRATGIPVKDLRPDLFERVGKAA